MKVSNVISINAHAKFRSAIINYLVDYARISVQNIISPDELSKILEILSQTNAGFTFDDIKKSCDSKIVEQSAKEIQFENGLIYVDSTISYVDNEVILIKYLLLPVIKEIQFLL